MKKSNSLLISLLFLFTVMVDAAKTDSTMFELESRSGVDGRMVFFPSNWKTSMGVDGRLIAFPKEWKTSMGTDGRIVAFPSTWKSSMGVDGRVIAFPNDWKTGMGTDGRLVAFPPDSKTRMGTDGRLVVVAIKKNAITLKMAEDMVSLFELYNLVNENQMVDFLKFIVK